MINNKYISLAVLTSLILAAPGAFANESGISVSNKMHGDIRVKSMGMGDLIRLHPNLIGTVTAVNGNTLTVTSVKLGWDKEDRENDSDDSRPTPVIYTVDASNAKVVKAGVVSTVSAIAVGDKVMVQGKITGTNVVATAIRDGQPVKTPKPTPTPVIVGNGQPVIAGTISAINGSVLTVTNKSNVTYTVDTSTAKVVSKGTLSTLSSVVIGDNVVVQGTINGTSISAYSVIDLGVKDSVKADGKEMGRLKFFGGIGHFFRNLFGF